MLTYELSLDKEPCIRVWQDKQKQVATIYLTTIHPCSILLSEAEWEDILIKARKFKELATLMNEKIKTAQDKASTEWIKFVEKSNDA